MINVNIFTEFNNEMVKFFQDLTKVKEEYLNKTIKNNIMFNEKTKITYKSINKQEKNEKKDGKEKILKPGNLTFDQNSLFVESKNTVKNHTEFLNKYWKDKINSYKVKESIVNDIKKTSNSHDSHKNKPSRNYSRNEEKLIKVQENETTKIFPKTEGRSRNMTKKSFSESRSKSRRNSQEIPKETSHVPVRNKTFNSLFNKTSQINNLNIFTTERGAKKSDSQIKGNINFWKNLMNSQERTYNSGTFNLPLVSVRMKTSNQI
jgi:hypothetical protein